MQHPVAVKNKKIEEINKMAMPVYLTEKEKKRISRNKRLEKEKEKQDMVKFGLMPAPPPKIKMSNYQKIMSKDAICDPSGTELIAKAIVQKRLEDHLQSNEDRKLKSEAKEQKLLRKHLAAQQEECHQALFRIDVDLAEQPQNKFKVKKNALQLHLGGLLLVIDKQRAPHLHNLVFVEGGKTTIKKYKRLMLRRVKWVPVDEKDEANDQESGDEEQLVESTDLKCHLIWEGVSNRPAFGKFQAFYDVSSDQEGRALFAEKDMEHLWTFATNLQAKRQFGVGD